MTDRDSLKALAVFVGVMMLFVLWGCMARGQKPLPVSPDTPEPPLAVPVQGPVKDWFTERFDKRFEERFDELDTTPGVVQFASGFVVKLVQFIWKVVKEALSALIESEVGQRVAAGVKAALWSHWKELLGALLVLLGTAGVFGWAGGRLAARRP